MYMKTNRKSPNLIPKTSQLTFDCLVFDDFQIFLEFFPPHASFFPPSDRLSIFYVCES